jgi:hypothetical protein
MFWERESISLRREMLFEIQKTLCNHHRNQTGPHAHPEGDFLAPEEHGFPASAPAAALAQSETSTMEAARQG